VILVAWQKRSEAQVREGVWGKQGFRTWDIVEDSRPGRGNFQRNVAAEWRISGLRGWTNGD